MSRTTLRRALRCLEQGLCWASKLAFPLHRAIGERWPGRPVTPRWAPGPLMRGEERSKPPLGWPRQTDSLCPSCVKEVRGDILRGHLPLSELVQGHHGEIRAEIVEEAGRVLMKKQCPKHGAFEDVMSIIPAFLQRIERLFPGRDYRAPKTKLRDHGTSSIKYGRGAVLTVDLTNRCNMMCDPCFMDANQVGYVHELGWEDITEILDASLRVKPRRQMSVQFSGGEPTLSPHFVRAIAYARQVGYFCVQAASNGVRFAESPELCREAKAAGLRLVYLQFDGTSNEAHAHRKVGNLFDVKRRAIDNLHAAGIDVVLVVTVVRGINDHQVGPVVRFAIENADKITVVSFQPVSFTGRDEDITDERREAQRYTLSHLARDLSAQLGATEPLRDWFPLSAMNPFSDIVDVLLGPDTDFGALKCGCHPNCGIGTVLVVNKRTKAWAPVCDFIDVERVLADLQQVADAGRGKAYTMSGVALSLARHFRPERAPEGYGLTEFIRQCTSQAGATGDAVGTTEGDAGAFEWRFLFVAGMWFQDLFNYDFRRTEMCIIPYGTQQGEISFCAYNTGVGWRQIIEQMHQTAKVAEWYREHGRHPVYAKGQDIALPAPAKGRRRLVVLEG
ncbi:MAG: radical SAM protein [Polyangiaceae bacterium]|nr:radical SAM protein [Polyangiaceae bacterium]MCW5789854.1 radical SAM protein [Polyangiaceae bacterium]